MHIGRRKGTYRAPPAWLLHAITFAIAIWAQPLLAQTCIFNVGQPNVANFGAVDPSLSTTYTWSLTINYKCTSAATAFFTITGANDTGPGAYQLRNVSQPTQYMAYTITAVDVPGTKITLTGQLVAANYQAAYVGNYTDTLSVLLLP